MRILVSLVAAAAVLVACGAGDEPEQTVAATNTAGPGPTGNCGPVETVPIQGEGHLVGDQDPPVPYNSTPPTSGWHTSGDVAFDVVDDSDPLREPEQVTVLELGGVVVTYNGLDAAQHDELAAIVGTEYAGLAAMTPYDALAPAEVAMASWGRLQRCSAPDPAAVRAFIEAYATAEPDEA